ELVGASVSLLHVLRASGCWGRAPEVLSTRIEMDGRTIVDTISDNAALRAMVLGGRPVAVDAVDLRRVNALLYRYETIEDSGVAAAVLDHPARGIVWLVNKLAEHGDVLPAGATVLAGSFTCPMWVHPGDTVHADYGELGAITCRFV